MVINGNTEYDCIIFGQEVGNIVLGCFQSSFDFKNRRDSG